MLERRGHAGGLDITWGLMGAPGGREEEELSPEYDVDDV